MRNPEANKGVGTGISNVTTGITTPFDVPPNVQAVLSAFPDAEFAFMQRTGREPGLAELVSELVALREQKKRTRAEKKEELPEDAIRRAGEIFLNMQYLPIEYTVFTGHVDPDTLEPIEETVDIAIPADDSRESELVFAGYLAGLRQSIDLSLASLTDREQEVIRSYYGIGRERETTKMIAERLHYSPYTISQIHRFALHRLRHSDRSDRLAAFIDIS
ncbi:MAG: hypothetical protein HY428_01600 [Candidatus Levybacteria bacterium]|nr:hypothetical protein [Candidatus Levybacteria bacterium]